ncbi:MAG: SseB family protein [Myxococcales bacterium]|nr:SseB family protein [Myxococcales bacterium]
MHAFRRLLHDAAEGGQAKVDALVALSQRSVWVATWTSLGDDYRTLVNSNGLSALPVFTSKDELHESAQRFGWLTAKGSVPSKEVGSREVMRHALAHNLEFIVVDIASDHAFEIERAEVEPLLRTSRGHHASGPYAGVGRISSDMIRAVKPSSRPPLSAASNGSVPAPIPRGGPVPLVDGTPEARFSANNTKASVPPPGPTRDRDSAGQVSVQITALQSEPSDALVGALSPLLRGFPEVEWAALCLVTRGGSGPLPHVGLRVDASFRERVAEIGTLLRRAGEEQGTELGILLLDDPEAMRTARSDGFLFYPWKGKK